MDWAIQKTKFGYLEAIPRPTQEELDAFYQKQYYAEGVNAIYHHSYPDIELAYRRRRSNALNEAASRALGHGNPVRFLEIGAGEGFLLKNAVERGWDALGVDFQQAPVERCNPDVAGHFQARNPQHYIESVTGTFDVIALQNVLEHVLDPVRLMDRIRICLRPGGVAVVQVPNDDTLLQSKAVESGRTGHRHWFLPPQHLNYFNTDTIALFAKAMGYRVADMFADFPIEFYLWGGGSNYVRDKSLGPSAHEARLTLDELLAERGIEPYLDFYRGLANTGMGRNLIVILRPSD
jgi:2-polyprenyl-3-methyl-5-hydroxy-6-metoxy-1,4-benzoquinol methylase